MPKRLHSSAILVVVFVLGLAAGIAGMVWAWPGVHARYFHPKHQSFSQHMQTTLQLTPQQTAQVRSVFADAGKVRHSIHLQYEPQYRALSEQFCSVYKQERSAYVDSPQRKQLLGKLQSIMTTTQWQGWEKMVRSHHSHHGPCDRSTNPPSPGSGSRPGHRRR
ncbi:MAG: hypothetical protein ACRD0Y_09590 [Terriglobales bacterium]